MVSKKFIQKTECFHILCEMTKWNLLSFVQLFATPWTMQFMVFSWPEYWSGSLSFLQGIFPTQKSNPCLPHCRQILYQQSHKGSPRILEWVAYPFSREYSRSRKQTRVFCIAGGFFTTELSGKPSHCYTYSLQFSSVSQSSLTLCNPMDCSTPGFPVHHQLPELTQTHAHRVGDNI